MSTVIVLETQDFVAASRMLRLWAAQPLGSATTALSRSLDGCGAMAGNDPGGAGWAASYDPAAAAALRASADAINAVDRLAAMFAQTARNYAAADAASTAVEHRLLDTALDALPAGEAWYGLPVCQPPLAAGGSGGGPPGWSLIEHAVGYVWPNGHQDRLRAASEAWSASAVALGHSADDVTSAAQLAIADRLPEADDMWLVTSAMAGHLAQLGSVHRALGVACAQLADRLDEAHTAIEGELASLVEWSAGIQAVGGLLSVVTLGAAEAPAQGMQAARVASTAARVAALIERFLAAARAVAQSVAGLAERAAQVSARVRTVLDTSLTEAAVTAVGRYRAWRLADEGGAIGRLVGDAARRVTTYLDREAARHALQGNLGASANRFFKGATSKSEGYTITELPGGRYRLQFFSPADNAGYGKLYVQTVDAQGRIVERYKDTLGPGGLIERKWMSGGER